MSRRLLRAEDYQHPDDLVRRFARAHERQIEQAIDGAISDFQEQQDDDAIRDAILAGGAAGVVSALGFSALRQDLESDLAPTFEGLFREIAAEAAQRSSVLRPASTDVIALPQASDTGTFYSDLAHYRDSLIDDIVSSSEDAVAAAVRRGAQANIPVDQLARAVRQSIGLTDRQAFAVFNFRRALEEGNSSLDRALDGDAWMLRDRRFDSSLARAARGEPVDQELIDRMVDAYAQRQLTYRARMIAETEAHNVANAAVRADYQQAVNNGTISAPAIRRRWLVALDERTCAICLSIPILNPNGVDFDAPFLSIDGPIFEPGAHPNCRCSISYSMASVVSAAAQLLTI
jgi:hypothetical protein